MALQTLKHYRKSAALNYIFTLGHSKYVQEKVINNEGKLGMFYKVHPAFEVISKVQFLFC